MTMTGERLRELLDYEPLTGVFTWAVARQGIQLGRIAGRLSNGYRRIMIDGESYAAHRLAWLFIHGSFPKSMLDHVNGDKDDNRITNLRLCDRFLNAQNLCLNGKGTTGYLGVTFDKSYQRFKAQIKFRGVNKFLGRFDTPIEAHQAYVDAKKVIHKFQGWQP